MKKITILAAVVFVFALVGCNKSKDCKCTTTQEWDIDEMDPMTTEQTLKIEKGNCSDLDVTATMDAGGQHYTQITKCVEI